MYPFSQPITPAARSHMEAQLSFFNDVSKSLFRSVQQYQALNLQLAQTLLEESTTTGQEMITADRPTDILSAAASHAQPAAGKVRAYQQHVSRLAADAQVDLAKVTEEHVSETTRTARALAEEVTRLATEETEKNVRNQQDAIKRFTDPFDRMADGAQYRQGQQGNEVRGSANLQSGSQGSQAGSEASHMQGASQAAAQSAAAQSGRQAGTARKE
ncbi:MAG: phasin family protein [Pseudomonadota bacterium]